MDTRTYEQYPLNSEQLGETKRYLKEQVELEVLFFEENPIAVELPTVVDLEVTDTPPGVKGDTAQGGTKPAILETGLTVSVPFFVNNGEIIRVDTRTGEYLERAG
jgi:elongation factor P